MHFHLKIQPVISNVDKQMQTQSPSTLSSKSNPDIFDCNLKTNYQILIILGRNIPDTTYHQMTILFPTSPNVFFCTTWENHNQWNITFLSNAIRMLN